MNAKQQELLDRLERVIDHISKSPKTMAEVIPVIEAFMTALEEIAEDLSVIPNEQVAKNVRETIAKLL